VIKLVASPPADALIPETEALANGINYVTPLSELSALRAGSRGGQSLPPAGAFGPGYLLSGVAIFGRDVYSLNQIYSCQTNPAATGLGTRWPVQPIEH